MPSSPHILAIDDDPGRYDYLRAVPSAMAVLLDYDLDGGEVCAACGGWPDAEKGGAYLDALVARAVPVIVSSCSAQANRASLVARLHRDGVCVAGIAADHFGAEMEWLGRLWAWGVFDAE